MDTYQTAQQGLNMLKQAIVELLTAHPTGLRNFQIASGLGLHLEQKGQKKDYVSSFVLELLIKEKAVIKTGHTYRLSRHAGK